MMRLNSLTIADFTEERVIQERRPRVESVVLYWCIVNYCRQVCVY